MLNLNIAYPPTPTRFGYNSANTIDIALIKNFYYPFTINSIDELSSDHNPVFLNFSFKLAIEPPNPRAVSTDCKKISELTDAVIETHSHASRPIEIDKRNFTPLHINRLLKLKNHLRKRYHQTLNPIFKTYYNKAQSDLKKKLKKYNDDIWQKRLEALNTTDNSLWRTQRFFKKIKDPKSFLSTGTAVTDQQKANLLATNLKNNFIENECENDSYNHNDENINSTINNFLSTPPTTNIEPALPDEIIHYIKHVNAKKAPGKDLITNRMLKNFPIKLILILTILVNKILKFNHFPDNWKEAIIFPINKPGKDPHLATSYRPISLLSTIGKLTESIILLRLKNFINSNNLLNPNQYGFTTKLSTLHPLLRLTEHISEGFQKKKSTGVVFLDIQKAFDRVWINGPTFKLISYNIPPPMIHLIHSYLTNRSFKVRINETLSNEHPVNAGCPQGRNSHLSIENKVLLYTAVMRPILAYASPVWGYAAKTNINKLDTLQNSLIRMIDKATRYMRNDDIRKDLKINSFKAYIQNTAINFFTNLDTINNVNIQNLIPYTPNDNTKRPRRILLDSYNPP
ncbi:probable RNA-directed DNA polymerase from transposon X-element [Trichonephila clavipes]|nr:probable RNA-directed DNA polymerase from transposon X-element [Trichonephila clavipes]